MALVKQCDICKCIINPGTGFSISAAKMAASNTISQYDTFGDITLQHDLCDKCNYAIMDYIKRLKAGEV